jgi:hypothetical protein
MADTGHFRCFTLIDSGVLAKAQHDTIACFGHYTNKKL